MTTNYIDNPNRCFELREDQLTWDIVANGVMGDDYDFEYDVVVKTRDSIIDGGGSFLRVEWKPIQDIAIVSGKRERIAYLRPADGCAGQR